MKNTRGFICSSQGNRVFFAKSAAILLLCFLVQGCVSNDYFSAGLLSGNGSGSGSGSGVDTGSTGSGSGSGTGTTGTGTGSQNGGPQIIPCTLTAADAPIVTSLPTGVTPQMVAGICPAVGADSECGVLIIVQNSGVSLYFTGQGPYDNIEDTLVGVINLSSTDVKSLNLSSNLDIMGFDSDGIDSYDITGTKTKISGNSMDYTGYGGPNAYFSNIANMNRSGTVNFINPVPMNGTTYFALENALTSTSTCLQTSVN